MRCDRPHVWNCRSDPSVAVTDGYTAIQTSPVASPRVVQFGVLRLGVLLEARPGVGTKPLGDPEHQHINIAIRNLSI